MSKISYPEHRLDTSISDDYFGTKVSDPFRWLEDPDSEETKKFVDSQNQISTPFLKSYSQRDVLTKRLTQLWDYEKYSCPSKHGNKYYYYYNSGLLDQSILYVSDKPDMRGTIFLDPNTLSTDGTVAISSTEFTKDGAIFAYGLSSSGSDWLTVHFKDTKSGKDLPDKLTRVKFSSMEFTKDNKGFFYNTYPKSDSKSDGTETTSNLHHKLYYHTMSTEQADDVLVFECPENPTYMIGCTISDCGHYLIVYLSTGCKPVNKLYYVNLQKLSSPIKGLLQVEKIVDNFDAAYSYVTNDGSRFVFKTNLKSPNYKLIIIDFDNHDQKNWSTLIEENEKDVLEWAACANKDKLIVCYICNVKSEMYLHRLSDGKRTYTFPLEIGTVASISYKKESSEIFYKFVSFLTPGKIMRLDLAVEGGQPTEHKSIDIGGIDTSQFVTKQIFYKSGDATIPMFIIHKKSLKMDGSAPSLLYGYGGFNHALQPSFSVMRLVFMQHFNGVMAVANIRGGGEYGETWHLEGSLFKKQNCFNDFKKASQYLSENKYTSHEKITIMGASNGGLLVGACINQSPELFGAAIAQVGVMDMLRFHKFTIGHAWTSDYGCANEDIEQFKCLQKYSPLHNVNTTTPYPATLVLTADHDDRVVPLHSLKYIAQLQHLAGKLKFQKQALMAKIDTKAGHGAGKPTAKIIEEFVDIFSFMAKSLSLQYTA